MEAMTNGLCPAKVYLSAVDPGVGKSQTVIHFARALMASPDHTNIGMIVCVGRIAEAAALAGELAIHWQHVAVLTSDPTANAIGGATPEAAQVLITTQQRIELATDRRTFAAVDTFNFQGARRAVRVWDEAWLPGVIVTIDSDDLFGLIKLARGVSSELADVIKDFADTLTDVPDGEAIAVPGFAEISGGSLYDVLAALTNAGSIRDDQKRTTTGLITMSGKVARVRRDGGRRCGTLLTYQDTLPDDLLPLLVLDASGRVRHTYADIEEHRRNLVRLPEAAKHYGPLKVHLWQTSGSKSGFATNGPALVKGIADTIATRPDEKWLVVIHKAGGRAGNVEAAIRRGLPHSAWGNVSVITWGNHLATNAYADVPNVILAGTLFMRPSFYTALTHLAQDRSVVPSLASRGEIAQTMRGEHANLILQALCRGRVRRSNGADCHPMNAYIIASGHSGIPKELATIFPGCTIVPWTAAPVDRGLTGKLKEAADYIQDATRKGTTRLSYRGIQGAIQVQSNNFRKLVTGRPAWAELLADLGMETYGGATRATGIRLKGAGSAAAV